MSGSSAVARRGTEPRDRRGQVRHKPVAVATTCPRMGCGNKPGYGTNHAGSGRCAHCESLSRTLALAQARLTRPVAIRPEFALLEFLAHAHGDFRYWTDRMRAYAAQGDDVAYNDMIRAREQTAKHASGIAVSILGAGIAERQVRLAEGMASRDAAVIREFCDRIGLTEAQALAAPEALRAALLLVGPPAAGEEIEAEWEEDV